MKTRCSLGVMTLTALTLNGAAQAESVLVDDHQQPLFDLDAGTVDNLFDAADNHWLARQDLIAVHDTLRDHGIETEGVITFLLAQTSEGLTFVTLMDDNSNQDPQVGTRTRLDLWSSAPNAAAYWMNDRDEIDVTTGESQIATGTFDWADNRGDAFIWTGLEPGDDVAFRFDGLAGNALSDSPEQVPFQWVTWSGEGWDITTRGEFDQEGAYEFNFAVVPVPAPILLGAAGLAVVAARRRRKKNAA